MHWDGTHKVYTCADGAMIICNFRETLIDWASMPRNGLKLRRGKPPALMVCGVELNRRGTLLCNTNSEKAYALPRSVKSVYNYVFKDMRRLQSVRLN